MNHFMKDCIDNSFEGLTILGGYKYAMWFRRVLPDAVMIVDNIKVNIDTVRKVLEWFMNTERIIKVFNKATGYKSLRLHYQSPMFVCEVPHLQVGMQCESKNHILISTD